LFWFLIIPFGLKLPTKQKTFKNYLKNIRLSAIKPVSRNILLGVTTFAIFSVFALYGAVFFGNYVFDPNILFGIPSILNLGWMIFIIALIPGIWEEVGFRGVMLPMLLKKYSKKRAIIINGLVFGLAHLFNLVSILLFGGFFWQLVFYQVIYASLMGFALAYMYIKTNSLLPCIIFHYLADSVGLLFLNVYFFDIFSLSVFFIVFIGIVPSFLIFITVKFTVNDEPSLENLRSSKLEEKTI
ncbi:MAG: lysostaphin resistance A-like protein, partial [Promethearchaeota archaeon]